VELYSEAMAAAGIDPLPDFSEPAEFKAKLPGQLILISSAAHHFVSSSLANLASLRAKEGEPAYLELHPEDAAGAGIEDGDMVIVENRRGSCRLRAVVTTNVLPGVAIAPKGSWQRLSPDGRNINWTTSDALADLAGQSTFHSNLVSVRPAGTQPASQDKTSMGLSSASTRGS
jgi:anaerobic selenocysteine-containing dehydrogenase